MVGGARKRRGGKSGRGCKISTSRGVYRNAHTSVEQEGVAGGRVFKGGAARGRAASRGWSRKLGKSTTRVLAEPKGKGSRGHHCVHLARHTCGGASRCVVSSSGHARAWEPARGARGGPLGVESGGKAPRASPSYQTVRDQGGAAVSTALAIRVEVLAGAWSHPQATPARGRLPGERAAALWGKKVGEKRHARARRTKRLEIQGAPLCPPRSQYVWKC